MPISAFSQVKGRAVACLSNDRKRGLMLFFFKVHVDHSGMSADELWEAWDAEADAAIGALEAGKLVSAYKVAGQRTVLGIVDADSHDELDQIFMAALPMAHSFQFEEILPVRDYKDFAADVKRRWQ